MFLRLNYEVTHNVIEREWFSSCPERVYIVAALYLLCGLHDALLFLNHSFLSFK